MGNSLVRYTAMALTIIGANAARGTDPNNGHEIVKRWCSSCHLIEFGQKSPTSEATPFATIAKRRGFDAAKLAFFLLDPHPKMPNMQLTRSEAADIAALYLNTQVKPHPIAPPPYGSPRIPLIGYGIVVRPSLGT